MTGRLMVSSVACLAAVALGGCVFVAKPRPPANAGRHGDRPVYVVVQGSDESPPSVKTTHGGEKALPAPAPGPGQPRSYRYDYYPLARVYYAADRARYYWLSARGWRVGSKLPKAITLDGEEPVVVELDSAVPYVHHAKVEAAFPGRGMAKQQGEVKPEGKGK